MNGHVSWAHNFFGNSVIQTAIHSRNVDQARDNDKEKLHLKYRFVFKT